MPRQLVVISKEDALAAFVEAITGLWEETVSKPNPATGKGGGNKYFRVSGEVRGSREVTIQTDKGPATALISAYMSMPELAPDKAVVAAKRVESVKAQYASLRDTNPEAAAKLIEDLMSL